MKKIKSYLVLGAAFSAAMWLSFTEHGEASEVDVNIAIFLAFAFCYSLVLNSKAGAAFVDRNSKLIVRAGWGSVLLGSLTFIWSIGLDLKGSPTEATTDLSHMAALSIVALGVILISTPRISRQTKQALAVNETFRAERKAGRNPATFDGIGTAIYALTSPFRNWRVFLFAASPWALATGAGAFIGVGGFGLSQGWIATAMIVGFLALVVGLPTFAVAWHLWIGRGIRPYGRSLVPGKSAFSYLWRLWISLNVINQVADQCGKGVVQWANADQFPNRIALGPVVEGLVYLAGFALFSPWALGMTAVALRDKEFTQALALGQGRRMWPGLQLGFALTLAPFIAFRISLQPILETGILGQGRPTAASLMVLGLLALFLAWACAATYLTQAFLQARGSLPANLSDLETQSVNPTGNA